MKIHAERSGLEIYACRDAEAGVSHETRTEGRYEMSYEMFLSAALGVGNGQLDIYERFVRQV